MALRFTDACTQDVGGGGGAAAAATTAAAAADLVLKHLQRLVFLMVVTAQSAPLCMRNLMCSAHAAAYRCFE